MYTHKLVALAFVLALNAGPAFAQNSGLGKPLSENDIKQWDIAILPDGSNLPPGSGAHRRKVPKFSRRNVRPVTARKVKAE